MKNMVPIIPITLYIRHAQHTARGPNVARGYFLFGPRTPNLWVFWMIVRLTQIDAMGKTQ